MANLASSASCEPWRAFGKLEQGDQIECSLGGEPTHAAAVAAAIVVAAAAFFPPLFFLVVSISVNRYTYKNQRCQKAKMTAKWIRKLTFRALRLAKHQREKPK